MGSCASTIQRDHSYKSPGTNVYDINTFNQKECIKIITMGYFRVNKLIIIDDILNEIRKYNSNWMPFFISIPDMSFHIKSRDLLHEWITTDSIIPSATNTLFDRDCYVKGYDIIPIENKSYIAKFKILPNHYGYGSIRIMYQNCAISLSHGGKLKIDTNDRDNRENCANHSFWNDGYETGDTLFVRVDFVSNLEYGIMRYNINKGDWFVISTKLCKDSNIMDKHIVVKVVTFHDSMEMYTLEQKYNGKGVIQLMSYRVRDNGDR